MGKLCAVFAPISIEQYFRPQCFDSFQLPALQGQPNVTALDLQMKSLRDAAMNSIKQMAICMKEEATDVKATVGDIEDWLDRIKQLAEEVCKETRLIPEQKIQCYGKDVTEIIKTAMLVFFTSLRTACQM